MKGKLCKSKTPKLQNSKPPKLRNSKTPKSQNSNFQNSKAISIAKGGKCEGWGHTALHVRRGSFFLRTLRADARLDEGFLANDSRLAIKTRQSLSAGYVSPLLSQHHTQCPTGRRQGPGSKHRKNGKYAACI